ncbi:leucine-rich repeat domain-containing protein, partial [Clostridium sp.]|uniref:leucine-rich repeat domain-containing protein n=1 Tax=Clostridium sp. TaxID=1506 RepID=UPI001B626893
KAEALDSDIVTFEDANLEAVVRKKLAKASGDITVGDMRSMTGEFCAHEKNISSLKGLEHAVNIDELCLYDNQISDITPLKDMVSLNYLYLNDNQISDITPLKDMTSLQGLNLNNNQISDITPLSNMTNLKYLEIGNNQISDISPLGKMKKLERLWARNNQINDISHLSNLTNLSELHLDNNQISDISHLSSLNKLTFLSLENNEINDISALKNMPNMLLLFLKNNKINDISSLKDMTNLMILTLNNNRVKTIPDFISGFTNLTQLDMRNNCLVGNIPEFLSNLTNLTYDYPYDDEMTQIYTSFEGNYLTGTVPTALKNRLGEEAFYGNLLEGENNQKQLSLIDGAELNLSLNSTVTSNTLKSITQLYYGEPGAVPTALKNRLGEEAFYGNLLEGETNQKQLTLIENAELNLSLNSSATSNTLKSITQLYDGEASHSKSLYELELVPVEEEYFDENGRAIKSGTTSAYIKIKDVADSNPYTKTLTPVQVNISNKIGSNNDITIEFSIDNTLEVTLGANNISFGTVSAEGGEIESATLTVTSSLPYDISTKAYGDFMGSSDSSNIIPIEKVSLDIDDSGYMELSKEKKLNLVDNPRAIDNVHNINFKIGNTLGYKKDNYRAELQFIIDTK